MTFYLTTPIYYVNSTPHIGHAYTTLAADILVRHHRQRGEDTFFLTGTDEHGSKVYRVAEEEGLDPKVYVDQIAEKWREVPEQVNAAIDFFIRTTDEGHKAFVQDFVQRIYDNGDIYEDTYAGLYCVGCEAFKSEEELVDGKCPEHDTVPEWIEEKNYFFRLSKYQEPLLKLYDERPDFVQPDFRRNEARSFIAGGLQDFSLSRAGQPWGVPVPWDPEQVVYVWVDALINYLSALTYARPGAGPPRALLAARQTFDRQGHPAVPLRLLAGPAPLGRVRGAAPDLRPRLPHARRAQDLEVPRQRHRSARADRRLRVGCGPVLGDQIRAVRPGRLRLDRQPPRAVRAGARQRPRQPRVENDGDDREVPGRADPDRAGCRRRAVARRSRRGGREAARRLRPHRRNRCRSGTPSAR